MDNEHNYSPSERWRLVIETSAVTGSTKAVLMALAYHADQSTGECWPSRSTLAKESGFSEDTIDRSLDLLCELGIVTVQSQSRGGARKTSRLRVNFDAQWTHQIEPNRPHGTPVQQPHSAEVSEKNRRNLPPEQPQGAAQTEA